MYIVTMVQADYNKALKRAYEDGFNKGKEFNKDDQNLNYRMGFNDGWHDCEASFELGNEFTDSIQEQAFDEGYDQAIDDLIEAGIIGEDGEDYLDEGYSEYEFGAVEDDEEEYCFSKELDKILNGERYIVLDGKLLRGEEAKDMQESLVESLSKSEEYKKGYEDGKDRGITIGFNKRDYAINNYTEVCNGSERKHSHYFKDVRHLDYVDVYEINKLFPVDDDTDCILHARKKLLVCGGRGGSKDMITDITEARDTLNRYLQIEGIE